MSDFIVLIILIVIIGGAILYIIDQKKKGVKCVGCACENSCSTKEKEHCTCNSEELK